MIDGHKLSTIKAVTVSHPLDTKITQVLLPQPVSDQTQILSCISDRHTGNMQEHLNIFKEVRVTRENRIWLLSIRTITKTETKVNWRQ